MTGVTYIALILVMVGVFVTYNNFDNRLPQLEWSLDSCVFVMYFAVPLLTMRSFAEERSSKTDQLLYALPTGMWRIIIGKYLAMITLHAIVVMILCFYPILFSFYVKVNFLKSYTGILAFFLLGCTLISIGTFISSLTENIVISAVVTFGVLMLLGWMPAIALLIPGTAVASLVSFICLALAVGVLVYLMTKSPVAGFASAGGLSVGVLCVYLFKSELLAGLFPKILDFFAVLNKTYNFLFMGIFDVTAVVYYVSLTVLFVFLTVSSVEKRRWS